MTTQNNQGFKVMSKTTAMLAAAALGAFFFISDANAAVLDVQFSGNFTLGYGYYLPGFYAAQQSGAAVIGSSGDKWNYFTSASASNQSLNTVTGAASGVSLTFSSNGAYTATTNYEAFAGTSTQNLMQGYLTNNFLMTLSGLAANSSYSLYVYTQGDNNSAGRGVTLSATGAGSATSLQTNAGSYILGNNYLLFQGATNALGQLTVTETSYNGEADINGFQLTTTTAVPEPATWAMMLLGFVGLGFAGTRREKLNRVDLAAA